MPHPHSGAGQRAVFDMVSARSADRSQSSLSAHASSCARGERRRGHVKPTFRGTRSNRGRRHQFVDSDATFADDRGPLPGRGFRLRVSDGRLRQSAILVFHAFEHAQRRLLGRFLRFFGRRQRRRGFVGRLIEQHARWVQWRFPRLQRRFAFGRWIEWRRFVGRPSFTFFLLWRRRFERRFRG